MAKKAAALIVLTLLLAPYAVLAGGGFNAQQQEQQVTEKDVHVTVNIPERHWLSPEMVAAVGGVLVAVIGTVKGAKTYKARKANK